MQVAAFDMEDEEVCASSSTPSVRVACVRHYRTSLSVLQPAQPVVECQVVSQVVPGSRFKVSCLVCRGICLELAGWLADCQPVTGHWLPPVFDF